MVSSPVSGLRADSFGYRYDMHEDTEVTTYMKDNVKIVCINDSEIPYETLIESLDLQKRNNYIYIYVLILTIGFITGMLIALSI